MGSLFRLTIYAFARTLLLVRVGDLTHPSSKYQNLRQPTVALKTLSSRT